MKTKLLLLGDMLRTSFWFIPGLMVLAAIALAVGLVSLDRMLLKAEDIDLDWTYTGGPEGARSVLATIATSMITVAGVVFSITIVALTLASSQFGPRILRNFIRDRGNQAVLGTFIATFIYCLLVLRTIRNDEHGGFVPSISVVTGVVLALAGLAVLIYFIHHVATSIRASQVVVSVTLELLESIDNIFPDGLENGPTQDETQPEALARFSEEETVRPIRARCSDYILAVDIDELMRIASQADVIVRLAWRPGHFVVAGDTLADVWPGDRVDDVLADALVGAIELGSMRTSYQDVEYCVDQLVEVAVRALSPGVNDPFTAMACVDRLGQALCILARRRFPSPYYYDANHQVRVVAYPVAFGDVLDEAFDQIRQYGRAATAVIIRQLETLERIADNVIRPADAKATGRQAMLVAQAGLAGTAEEADRRDVNAQFARVQSALARSGHNSAAAAP